MQGCGCLKQKVDMQSGGGPSARDMFAGKMCVQRRDVQSAGGKNKQVGKIFVQRRDGEFLRMFAKKTVWGKERSAAHTPQ